MSALIRLVHFLRQPAACLLILTLSAAANASAAEPVEVGVVADYSPPGASLYFERASNSRSEPVKIGSVVYAGDRIRLLPNSSATIAMAGDRRVTPTGPGVWQMPAAQALGTIASIFHRFEFIIDPDYAHTATAITRGMGDCRPGNAVPIRVPILVAGAKMTAGRRGLSLTWSGGCPPYRVALQSGRGLVAEKRGIGMAQWRFEALVLEPGSYLVSIASAADPAPARFPIMAELAPPAPPQEVSSDTSALGTVARALWLADADQGRWRLDSVEQLLPLSRQHDALATAVVQMLLMHPPEVTRPAR